MTERDFILWLKGYFEIHNPKSIPETETQIIRDHLEKFFTKVTPERQVDIKVVADPSLKQDEVKIVPQRTDVLDKYRVFTPRCQGGTGHCGGLGCNICNSPLVITC